MRILQLTSTLPLSPTGSEAPFILHIARSLGELGHEVHILAPHHPGLQWPAHEGNVHFHFFKYAPFSRWNIWGYGQSLHSDVHLKWGIYGLLPLAAASAMRHLHRLQKSSRPFDILHAHWLLPNGPIAAMARHHKSLPLAISLHGSDMYAARKNRAFRYAARYALRRASAVVGCSGELTQGASSCHPSENLYHVLPYGVDEDIFKPGERAADNMTILAAGRLVEKKGFEYLLMAMKQMRCQAKLIIAGNGDLRERLARAAAELALNDRIYFAGRLRQPEMLALYRSASIFALPSIHDSGGNVDGLPNVLLEAMSSGLAIVASRIGGVPQVVRDGDNGLMVDEKSPEQLASALDSLLTDSFLRNRLASAARRTIVENYTWHHYGRKLESIMEGVRQSC